MQKKLKHDFYTALETGDHRNFARSFREQISDERLAEALVSASQKLAHLDGIELESAFLAVTHDDCSWSDACHAFDSIRAATLKAVKLKQNPMNEAVLLLQENVLKHLCLIRANSRRFDADSGDWAIVCLMNVLIALPQDHSERISDIFLRTATGFKEKPARL